MATINSDPYSTGSGGKGSQSVVESYPHGYEGEKKYLLHLAAERDRRLRDQKVKIFLEENGRLYCELCGFSFIDTYAFLRNDIIEVHHIVPLATLKESTQVTPDDLMLLCANCHLAVHQGDAEENLLVAMVYFENTNAKA